MSVDDLHPHLPTSPGDSQTNIPGALASGQTVGKGPRAGHNNFQLSFSPGEPVGDRYLIVRFIGRGGMGEVYEVNDKTLNEVVALKVISRRIASDERVQARFKREIQLARKVTHPCVCRIFDVGTIPLAENNQGTEPQELLFLTMELLKGETLAQRLRRSGRLSVAEARPMIEQVIAGLTAAHSAGVIHRDLKASNVILVPAEKGFRAVVTDFGLAHSTSIQNAEESVSLANEIGGTPEYISPEQLEGKQLSPATDIYSLGVMMYVMLTGRLPFEGGDRIAVASKRLVVKPPSPRMHVADLDAEWTRVINRCLERQPKDRYSHASQVADALASRPQIGRLAGTLTIVTLLVLTVASVLLLRPAREWLFERLRLYDLPAQKQLAILPFTATDGSPDSGAFARGLAQTLTSRLTRLTRDSKLQILPVDEVRGGHIETVQQARREFGVNLGVEGSVEHYKSTRRVTYHLVDARNLRQIYGETITAEDDDPFALEDRIAGSVESALRIAITPNGRNHEPAVRTQPETYDFYLQGRGYLDELATPQSIQNAIDVFTQALSIDPNYAPAHAGLGEAFWAQYQAANDPKWVAKAKDSCKKSIGLDGEGAPGHICLGTVYDGIGDYSGAVTELRRAVSIDPSNDSATRKLASALEKSGSVNEAEDAYKGAIRLRPNYWRGYKMLGVFYFGQGHYGEAEKMFRHVIALSPDNYNGYSNLGATLLMGRRYKEAIPLFEQASRFRPTSDAFANLGSAYFYLRRYAEAATAFQKAVDLDGNDYLTWGNLAEVESRMAGKKDASSIDYKKAISLGEQRLRLNPKDADVIGDLALYYSMLGEKRQATSYAEALAEQRKRDPNSSFRIATVYKHCGETDLALRWLARALQAGYPHSLVLDSPSFEDMRGDPRFTALLANANGL